MPFKIVDGFDFFVWLQMWLIYSAKPITTCSTLKMVIKKMPL